MIAFGYAGGMKRSRLAIALAGAVYLLGVGCSKQTTVVLVRHAETAEGRDPVLSEQGRARAEALAAVARSEGVEAIYVTPLRRTKLTAAPAAELLGLTPYVVPIESTPSAHATLIASDILKNRRGQRVLVVGHSNTVPMIAAELGAPTKISIAESEYFKLFVLRLSDSGEVELTEGTYGP